MLLCDIFKVAAISLEPASSIGILNIFISSPGVDHFLRPLALGLLGPDTGSLTYVLLVGQQA